MILNSSNELAISDLYSQSAQLFDMWILRIDRSRVRFQQELENSCSAITVRKIDVVGQPHK